MRVSKKGGVSVGTVAILEGGRTGYFADTYGPAVYDIYFESAKGGAEGLVEASTRSIVSGAQILDVGTGTGNVAFEAARRFADASVIGVDIAEQALELARHKAAEYSLGNVEFRQGDALALSFEDNTFDVVLANQVVGGPTTQRKMLSEMLRVVRPNGAIAVAKSNPADNEVMHWIDDVALEMAHRHSMVPPRPDDNPWRNTLPLHEMLEDVGVREITTERIVAAHTDLSTFMINLMTMGRNLLELVDYVAQCESSDSGAQARGCWEFLQVGRELIDRNYGGTLQIACEVVSGAKTE